MTKLSNDTNNLAELYHYVSEDILITTIKFFGTFTILYSINAKLTLLIFAFIPPMLVYAFYFIEKMHIALRASRGRIGDVKATIEDSLNGIRVVSSYTNEQYEKINSRLKTTSFYKLENLAIRVKPIFRAG
ncbi:MAG: ATP-binding cassette subfamily B protein [Candidatus Azotimanducaceae bacterium]|jgi:ATP-binding cassette subfamily B protein